MIDDLLSFGIVYMTSERMLVRANKRAMDIFEQQDGLCIESGRVVAGDIRDERYVQAIMIDSARKDLSPGYYRAGIVPRRRNHNPLFVVNLLGEGMTILVIQDPCRTSVYPEKLLGAWLGLTKREAQLASLLARGMCVEAAADQLNISTGTVRSHIRHVFAKCGVRSQMELVAKICSLMPPIDIGSTEPIEVPMLAASLPSYRAAFASLPPMWKEEA